MYLGACVYAGFRGSAPEMSKWRNLPAFNYGGYIPMYSLNNDDSYYACMFEYLYTTATLFVYVVAISLFNLQTIKGSKLSYLRKINLFTFQLFYAIMKAYHKNLKPKISSFVMNILIIIETSRLSVPKMDFITRFSAQSLDFPLIEYISKYLTVDTKINFGWCADSSLEQNASTAINFVPVF